MLYCIKLFFRNNDLCYTIHESYILRLTDEFLQNSFQTVVLTEWSSTS